MLFIAYGCLLVLTFKPSGQDGLRLTTAAIPSPGTADQVEVIYYSDSHRPVSIQANARIRQTRDSLRHLSRSTVNTLLTGNIEKDTRSVNLRLGCNNTHGNLNIETADRHRTLAYAEIHTTENPPGSTFRITRKIDPGRGTVRQLPWNTNAVYDLIGRQCRLLLNDLRDSVHLKSPPSLPGPHIYRPVSTDRTPYIRLRTIHAHRPSIDVTSYGTLSSHANTHSETSDRNRKNYGVREIAYAMGGVKIALLVMLLVIRARVNTNRTT
ncbi:b90 [miniopterid betaherpesvirus 1]|uniref:B90 n=1 Tax=miniopterid betaherpesvirus 1 TaxID=3070189 RepID=I3VQ83_9BETA|nr:b90 [miniopterid betaherpesvirus 1]AFK83927.1 b90 [miniopterid betaherpesvirus 1]